MDVVVKQIKPYTDMGMDIMQWCMANTQKILKKDL